MAHANHGIPKWDLHRFTTLPFDQKNATAALRKACKAFYGVVEEVWWRNHIFLAFFAS